MKRYLLASDLHDGSDTAIKPRKIIQKDDETVHTTLTPFQKKLYSAWEEMCDTKYDGAIVNGDLVDGTNDKSKGLGTWTTDMDLQSAGAANLLKMVKSPKTYIINGSPYHRGTNPSGDRMVVTKLNELYDRSDCLAVTGGNEIQLSLDGLKFHVSHQLSNTFYHGTALNRELLWSYIYKYDIKGIIRAHLHSYHLDSDGSRLAVMTPGWKGRDEYIAKFGLRFKPQIGWAVIEVSSGEANVKPYVMDIVSKIREAKL